MVNTTTTGLSFDCFDKLDKAEASSLEGADDKDKNDFTEVEQKDMIIRANSDFEAKEI
jgi:hypothetical protein